MDDGEDLRRSRRLDVCCRVDVRDRFGVWTAVTADLSDRGCRLVTANLPRVGSVLQLTLSSDLFPESLEVLASVEWVTSSRVGVRFLESAGAESAAAAWVARVTESGRVEAPGPRADASARIVPVVRRASRDGADGTRVRGRVVVPLRRDRG